MEQPSSEEDITALLNHALEKHWAALAAFMSAEEGAEAREAYLRGFELIYYQTPQEENWEAAFENATRKAVDALIALGPAGPQQVLRDQRLLNELFSINGHVADLAERVLLQELQVTSEMRQETERLAQRLDDLARTIKAECPYLTNAELPEPALRLRPPRAARQALSESLADCLWVSGKTRFMSLRLGRLFQKRAGGQRP